MKILFSFPTRSRPLQFKESFASLIGNIEDWGDIEILIKLDVDDKSLHGYIEQVKDYLAYPVRYTIERSLGKIYAQNRNLTENKWDIIFNWSDDLFVHYKGFEGEVRKVFKENGLDILVGFWDGHRDDDLPTIAVMGREFFDRFGYFTYPGYESVVGDNEMRDVAKLLSRYKFIKQPHMFMHQHPNYTGGHRDELLLYTESPAMYKKDGDLYKARKLINFGLI